NVELFTAKESYLCRLYALLLGRERGHLPTHEMRQMAKAFAKFMAYKPVNNIDQFVRESVLDAANNKSTIQEVSSLMKEVSAMRNEAERIEEAVATVRDARTHNNDFLAEWLRRHENRTVMARAQHRLTHALYIDQKNRQKTLIQDVEQHTAELTTL